MEKSTHFYMKMILAKKRKSKVGCRVFEKKYSKKMKMITTEYKTKFNGNNYKIDVFGATDKKEPIYIEAIVTNRLEIYRKILNMPKEYTYIVDFEGEDPELSFEEVEAILRDPDRYYTLEEYMKKHNIVT